MNAIACFILFVLVSLLVALAQAADEVEIETTEVADGLYMLSGPRWCRKYGCLCRRRRYFSDRRSIRRPFTKAIRTAIKALGDETKAKTPNRLDCLLPLTVIAQSLAGRFDAGIERRLGNNAPGPYLCQQLVFRNDPLAVID